MSILDKLNPYALAFKLAGIGIAVVAVVALAMSWMGRGQEIARLNDWQTQVVIATTDATVEPDAKGVRKPLKPEQVVGAINGLNRGLVSARSALTLISTQALEAKQRADNADKALATATVVFEQRYSSAEKRIAALDKKTPGKTVAEQCAAIQGDSKAAWEGWR